MTTSVANGHLPMLNGQEQISDTPRGIDLRSEALLVKLKIGQAPVKRSSEKVQMKAAEGLHADPESVEGKARIIQREAIAEITAAVSKARSAFYLYTIPWDDSGYRLLAVKFYPKLKKVLDEAQMQFFDAVQSLSRKRDQLADQARTRLGEDIFNEVGFPSEQELLDDYKFQFEEMPVSDPKDLRLNHVSQEQLQAIQQGVQARFDAKLDSAVGDIIDRLMGAVGNIKEQCSKEKPRIYDSLIGNLQELVEILPSLNMTDNPEIARLIRIAERDLASIDPDDLRADDDKRAQAASKADSLLEELKSFRSR